MPKRKKERRRQTPTKVVIKFEGLYPYDKATGADIEPHQLEERFTHRIADQIGDILASDTEIGFNQEQFEVRIKID